MELVYTIQRSAKRRKLSITVERDRRVVVHAPEGASDEKIRQVVESKRQWIYEKTGHAQKYRDLPHTPRFWTIVRAQSPTMEKAKIWLRENGHILEEDI